MMVIVNTSAGSNSGFLLIRLVLRLPDRTLLQMARPRTIRVAMDPISTSNTRLSNDAPIAKTLPLHLNVVSEYQLSV